MSAIMAGMMFLTFSQDGQQETAASDSAPKTKNKNVPSTPLKTSNIAPSLEPSPQTAELPSAVQITTERLNLLKGRKLVAELESFWHECMSNRDCEEQLALLEPYLQRIPYLLVAGDREVETRTISVRAVNGEDLGSCSIEAVSDLLHDRSS